MTEKRIRLTVLGRKKGEKCPARRAATNECLYPRAQFATFLCENEVIKPDECPVLNPDLLDQTREIITRVNNEPRARRRIELVKD